MTMSGRFVCFESKPIHRMVSWKKVVSRINMHHWTFSHSYDNVFDLKY